MVSQKYMIIKIPDSIEVTTPDIWTMDEIIRFYEAISDVNLKNEVTYQATEAANGLDDSCGPGDPLDFGDDDGNSV